VSEKTSRITARPAVGLHFMRCCSKQRVSLTCYNATPGGRHLKPCCWHRVGKRPLSSFKERSRDGGREALGARERTVQQSDKKCQVCSRSAALHRPLAGTGFRDPGVQGERQIECLPYDLTVVHTGSPDYRLQGHRPRW